jgi:hypothetical protein
MSLAPGIAKAQPAPLRPAVACRRRLVGVPIDFIPKIGYDQALTRQRRPRMAKPPRSQAPRPPRSQAQRAASRANGRKSRGPRTEAGKSRSRCNAVKHGLRAASLDIVASDGDAPSLALVAAVHDRLVPGDAIEVELANGIALAYWRLRRTRALEEALLAGRQPAANASSLARFLLGRIGGAGALTLLLRYRNQALGELTRLGRLLEHHRNPPSLMEAGGEPASQTPPSPAAAHDTRPANDNRSEVKVAARLLDAGGPEDTRE